MESRNYNRSELVINFWSNGKSPFHNLSNFASIPDGIDYDGIIYSSTEHAFQAQKYILSHRHRFSITGDLGGWNGLRLVYKPEEYEKLKGKSDTHSSKRLRDDTKWLSSEIFRERLDSYGR